MSELVVWMNGERVAVWREERGAHQLRYDESWLASPRCRSLSLSLPITPDLTLRGPAVEHYFDNLLPDARRIRERVRRRFDANSLGAFDLLQAIGRDCVGAVQLLPPGEAPEGFDRLDYETLSEGQVEQLLVAATSDNGTGEFEHDEALRISLAGAQEKTALLRIDGRWCLPRGATPTTHILKLPLGLIGNQRVDMRDSVENEWLCLNLLEELGIRCARVEIVRFGAQKVLAVERFDRAWMDGGGWIARLPQEDLCQALGVPPELKYERPEHPRGRHGPGMDDAIRLLRGSTDAPNDIAAFVLTQFAFWMVGNTDGHAKNFSIFLNTGDTYALTPVYDVISMWPLAGDAPSQQNPRKMTLAMSLRTPKPRKYLHEMAPAHWAHRSGTVGVPGLWEQMRAMAAQAPAALDRVSKRLPDDFPDRVWDRISDAVLERAGQLASVATA